MPKYLTCQDTRKALGVCGATLRNWARDGKIKYIRTPGKHRLYDITSLEHSSRRKVIYARVSSKNQKDDLEKQIKFLRERYPNHDVVSDIGSGINFKRKNFNALLEDILQGNVGEVVVAHRDRLCRFGFELIERIAEQFGCKIMVLDETFLSPQEELVRDIISIIHVFSCRIYGLRKYTTEISKDKDLGR